MGVACGGMSRWNLVDARGVIGASWCNMKLKREVASGKQPHKYGTSPFLMENSL